MTTAGSNRNWQRSHPQDSDAWVPTLTPTAACCCVICACPISVITRSTSRSPGYRAMATRTCSENSFATCPRSTRSNANLYCSRRDGVQRSRSRLRKNQPPVDCPRSAHRCVSGHDRTRDGNAQRTSVRRLARGLPADGASRPVQLLRGIHPHRRLDVQPARQVAESDCGACVAQTHRVAQLSCCRRTYGDRITTASPTRTRDSSITWSTRKPKSSACICRRMPTACCPSWTTACAAATTSMSSSRESIRRRSGCRWTPRSSIAPRASASGNGRAMTRTRRPTS